MALRAQLNNLATFTTTSATVEVDVGLAFKLNDFTGYGDFTTVFDQYRIDLIEVWIEPSINTAVNTYQEVGNYVTVVDVDDATAPSNIYQLFNKPGAQISKLYQGQYHRWVPSSAVAAYAGAFTSYQSSTLAWCDSGSPGIQFYGLKAAFTASTAATLVSIRSRITVSFRGKT